jgi:large subunit ribosomal protein L1
MASTSHCLASLARLSISAAPRPTVRTLPRFLIPSLASGVINGSRGFAAKKGPNIVSPKEKAERDARRAKLAKKKRRFKDFRVPDLNKLDQFTLCDAMRYVSF